MFQLTGNEVNTYLLEKNDELEQFGPLRSQFVTSKTQMEIDVTEHIEHFKKGGRKTFPYALTEQGIAMLSSVLNSPTAIQINIQIIRIFIKMREMVSTHIELQQKIEAIEQSLGSTNHAVQELYNLFIELVEQNTDNQERKIGFKTI